MTRSQSIDQHTKHTQHNNPHSVLVLNTETASIGDKFKRITRRRCNVCHLKTRFHCCACEVGLCDFQKTKRQCAEIHVSKFYM